MINKKGQIGDTLTWVIAVIIIFFIIVLFTGLSGYLAAKKNVVPSDLSGNTNQNEIVVSNGDVGFSRDLALQRDLLGFLNYYSKDGKISDLLLSGEENYAVVNSEARNYFDELYSGCYSFCFYSGNINEMNAVPNLEVKSASCIGEYSPCSYYNSAHVAYLRGIYSSDASEKVKKAYINISDGKTAIVFKEGQ